MVCVHSFTMNTVCSPGEAPPEELLLAIIQEKPPVGNGDLTKMPNLFLGKKVPATDGLHGGLWGRVGNGRDSALREHELAGAGEGVVPLHGVGDGLLVQQGQEGQGILTGQEGGLR